MDAPASEVGRWLAPQDWPVIAIHAMVLPTGEVLHYAYPPERDGGPSIAKVWNPATGSFRDVSMDLGLDVYCSGHSFLPDGRLYVTGGWNGEQFCTGSGHAATHVFDPFTSEWTRLDDMRSGRYYPTNVPLADGRTLILSGRTAGCLANRRAEVFDPVAEEIELLGPLAPRLKNYPRAFQLGNGRVVDVGPEADTRKVDPGTGQWEVIARTQLGLLRWEGTAFIVPGRRANTVMLCGGHTNEHGDGAPTDTCELGRFRAHSASWQVAPHLHFLRAHANAVLLPDGKVLVVGGGQEGKYTTPVLNAELYDPVRGTWTLLPPQHWGRMYHSTALLLSDGRVLSAGQDDDPSDGEQSGRTAEIYKPPYLFHGPRPRILEAPAEISYGAPFTIRTGHPERIERVVLMGLPTVTHSVDATQRYLRLRFSVTGPHELTARSPRAGRTPPGYYMLFELNGEDVPSKAKFVRLG